MVSTCVGLRLIRPSTFTMFVATEQDKRLLNGFRTFVVNLTGLLEQAEDVTENLGMHMGNHILSMCVFSLRNMTRDLEAVSSMLETSGNEDSGSGTFGQPPLASTAIGAVRSSGLASRFIPATVNSDSEVLAGDVERGGAGAGPPLPPRGGVDRDLA